MGLHYATKVTYDKVKVGRHELHAARGRCVTGVLSKCERYLLRRLHDGSLVHLWKQHDLVYKANIDGARACKRAAKDTVFRVLTTCSNLLSWVIPGHSHWFMQISANPEDRQLASTMYCHYGSMEVRTDFSPLAWHWPGGS